MRIGILTFHSQLNYGGVLQCWALAEALRRMGHEPVVLDRWLSPARIELDGPLGGNASVLGWLKIAVRSLLGSHELSVVRRRLRTKRFLKDRLTLSSYHFLTWKDAPPELGIDRIVVGSDQVWNVYDAELNGVYLLKDAPPVPASAYAVSFGTRSIPERLCRCYAEQLPRFSNVGVREREGVKLVEMLGGSARHVVDPTLLLDRTDWKPSAGRRGRMRLVCYFLSENAEAMAAKIVPWAKARGMDVDVLSQMKGVIPLKDCLKSFIRHPLGTAASAAIRYSFGPEEFLEAFRTAELCITDSFHALMFSCIFGLNCRFLRPRSEVRQAMFSRIEEFAAECTRGPLVVEDVDTALVSLAAGERTEYEWAKIDSHRRESLAFLAEAVK